MKLSSNKKRSICQTQNKKGETKLCVSLRVELS